MRKNNSLLVIGLFVVLMAQWSCRADRDILVEPNENSISVNEAQNWFEGKNARARVAAKAPTNRLAYWKYAKDDRLPNGIPVAVVPLLYGYDEPLMARVSNQRS